MMKVLVLLLFGLCATPVKAELLIYTMVNTNRAIGKSVDWTFVTRGFLAIDMETYEAKTIEQSTDYSKSLKLVTVRTPSLHISQVTGPKNVKYTILSEVSSGSSSNDFQTNHWTMSNYKRGANRTLKINANKTVKMPEVLTGIGRIQFDEDHPSLPPSATSSIVESRGTFTFASQATLKANQTNETLQGYVDKKLAELLQKGFLEQEPQF